MVIRNARELERALEENRSQNVFRPEYEMAAVERRRRWRKRQWDDVGYARQIKIMNRVISVVGVIILVGITALIIALAR